MPKKKKEKNILNIFQGSEEERMLWVSSLIPEIKHNLESSVYPNMFVQKYLELGEINSIPKNPRETAIAIDESGEGVEMIETGDRIFPPEFWITAKADIPVDILLKKQYNVRERTIDKVSFTLMRQLEILWYKLIYEAAVATNRYTKFTKKDKIRSLFSKNYIIDYLKEGHKISGTLSDFCFAMNRDTYTRLPSLFHKLDKYGDICDNFKRGLSNVVIGFISDTYPDTPSERLMIPDNILILLPKEGFIKMNIRHDIQVFCADRFKDGEMAFGFLFGQMQSLCIPDCSQVAIIELPE